MGVLTRKRASAAADGPPSASSAKRSRTASSSPLAATPTRRSPAGAGSPRASRPRQKASSVPKKGGLFESSLLAATALSAATSRRLAFEPFPNPSVGCAGSRGAAFLAAAGIAVPAASPLPAATTQPQLVTKGGSAVKPQLLSVPRSRSKANNPLLQQELPRQLSALLDMFGEGCGRRSARCLTCIALLLIRPANNSTDVADKSGLAASAPCLPALQPACRPSTR